MHRDASIDSQQIHCPNKRRWLQISVTSDRVQIIFCARDFGIIIASEQFEAQRESTLWAIKIATLFLQ